MTASPVPVIALAAGGTGGHLFPAEALAAELRARGARPVLVTDRRGGRFGGSLAEVEVLTIRAGGLAGRGWGARLGAIAELAMGYFEARRLIARAGPDVVVGFGGYASVPTVMAASVAGIHTVVHEQNAVLGRANRLLARRVDRIATAFARVRHLPPRARTRTVQVGMPVRPAFLEKRDRSYQPPSEGAPVRLLVLGGSQGAQVFGEVLPAAIAHLAPALRQRLRISQQCRPEALDSVRAAYAPLGVDVELSSFFTDVPERLSAAHLVIARAGASTVAELTAVGRPAILVPYPHAIDDHQTANAEAVEAAGAGWLVLQPTFSDAWLAECLARLLMRPAELAATAVNARSFGMPDAAVRLADLVLSLAGNGEQAVGQGQAPRLGRLAA